ncbi:MAG TPA: hypothetical protein VKU91_00330 [Acidimicrobiales bacterium]|nr:hypothetical protein [Acidimicrobiales bacterium]
MTMMFSTDQASAGWPAWPPFLHLREVLALPGVAVAAGDDGDRTYLVVCASDPGGEYWICAPATERAIDCVRAGQTSPWSVVHHSATGTVEVWRRRPGGAVTTSVLTCAAVAVPGGAAL